MIKAQLNNQSHLTNKYDLISIVGSIMSGCVSATAACNNITPTSAVLIGFIGAIVYGSTLELLLKLEIDDPL